MPLLPRLRNKLKTRFIPDYHFFPRGYALYPVDITLQLTFACNVRCTMCYQHVLRDGDDHRQDYLPPSYPSVDDYQRLLRDCRRTWPHIRLTGGEPFVYPHLMELAAYVKKLGLPLTIPTNGTFLKTFAREVVETPVDVLIVSLNGPEAIHDKIVKKPGSFKKALAGLSSILSLRRNGKPRVVVNIACANENQHYMLEMVKLIQAVGADTISFTHLWYWPDAAVERQNRDFPEFGKLQPTSTEALQRLSPEAMIENIQAIKGGSFKIPVSFYPDLEPDQIARYYRKPEDPLGERRCLVPWMVTYVRPNGDVAPSYLDYTVGNIKEKRFGAIWNGAPMRRLRVALKKHRQFPACKRCTGSFLFRQDGSGRAALTPPG